MIEGAPNCICLPGFEDTEQGCYPTSQRGKNAHCLILYMRNSWVGTIRRIVAASCDVEDNCSSNGICNFDAERQKHVCICLPGFVGKDLLRDNAKKHFVNRFNRLIEIWNISCNTEDIELVRNIVVLCKSNWIHLLIRISISSNATTKQLIPLQLVRNLQGDVKIELLRNHNGFGRFVRNRAISSCSTMRWFANESRDNLPCQRSLSFPGDGYTCYPEAEPTAVDEPPKPQCVEEMCWCPRGWEYRNNECMPQEGSGRSTDVSPDRDCKYNKGTFVQMHSSTAVSLEFVWFINLGFENLK